MHIKYFMELLATPRGHGNHSKNKLIVDPCLKSKCRWKVDFAFLNFRTFTNVIKFGMYLPY
jgi:hypothetical protein